MPRMMEHIKFSQAGMIGGKSKSPAKRAAAQKNAAKARKARKQKYPRCPKYKNGSHRFNPQGLCYSPECRKKYPDLRQITKSE